jgi:hypothetical protein
MRVVFKTKILNHLDDSELLGINDTSAKQRVGRDILPNAANPLPGYAAVSLQALTQAACGAW